MNEILFAIDGAVVNGKTDSKYKYGAVTYGKYLLASADGVIFVKVDAVCYEGNTATEEEMVKALC